MTTGRINQVTRLTSIQRQPPDANPSRSEARRTTGTERTCEVRRLLNSWAQGPPNNQQISQTVRRQFNSQSKEKRVPRSERGDHNDAKRTLTGGFDLWVHVSMLGRLPRCQSGLTQLYSPSHGQRKNSGLQNTTFQGKKFRPQIAHRNTHQLVFPYFSVLQISPLYYTFSLEPALQNF